MHVVLVHSNGAFWQINVYLKKKTTHTHTHTHRYMHICCRQTSYLKCNIMTVTNKIASCKTL